MLLDPLVTLGHGGGVLHTSTNTRSTTASTSAQAPPAAQVPELCSTTKRNKFPFPPWSH